MTKFLLEAVSKSSLQRRSAVTATSHTHSHTLTHKQTLTCLLVDAYLTACSRKARHNIMPVCPPDCRRTLYDHSLVTSQQRRVEPKSHLFTILVFISSHEKVQQSVEQAAIHFSIAQKNAHLYISSPSLSSFSILGSY